MSETNAATYGWVAYLIFALWIAISFYLGGFVHGTKRKSREFKKEVEKEIQCGKFASCAGCATALRLYGKL